MENGIETDLTLMQIYPHTDSRFHRFMSLMTAMLFPVGIILFPIMVLFKFICYSCFYLATLPIAHTRIYKKVRALKDCLLLPFHHGIYKTFYIYITIWLNGAVVMFDDYWFGLDKEKYKNYEDFRASYRRAVTRRRFREKLAEYDKKGFIIENLKTRHSFYRILFSPQIYKLIKDACFRKNGNSFTIFIIPSIIREYYLLLLLPMNVRVYRENNEIVGLSSCLIRGNTFVICQCLIATQHTKSGIFYKAMHDFMEKAFSMEKIRYISSGPTANQSKETSGYTAINFLLTDEFKYVPFSLIE